MSECCFKDDFLIIAVVVHAIAPSHSMSTTRTSVIAAKCVELLLASPFGSCSTHCIVLSSTRLPVGSSGTLTILANDSATTVPNHPPMSSSFDDHDLATFD